jgi:hypothetical protein
MGCRKTMRRGGGVIENDISAWKILLQQILLVSSQSEGDLQRFSTLISTKLLGNQPLRLISENSADGCGLVSALLA